MELRASPYRLLIFCTESMRVRECRIDFVFMYCRYSVSSHQHDLRLFVLRLVFTGTLPLLVAPRSMAGI